MAVAAFIIAFFALGLATMAFLASIGNSVRIGRFEKKKAD